MKSAAAERDTTWMARKYAKIFPTSWYQPGWKSGNWPLERKSSTLPFRETVSSSDILAFAMTGDTPVFKNWTKKIFMASEVCS